MSYTFLPIPKNFCLVSGKSEGVTELNAFDNALLDAGIGNANLIKVTSIIPAGCTFRKKPKRFLKGEFIPVVYAEKISSKKGMRIAAALGVGTAPDGFGVVVEAKGATIDEVEKDIEKKIKAAFKIRRLKIKEIKFTAREHQVKKCGCVLAACLYW